MKRDVLMILIRLDNEYWLKVIEQLFMLDIDLIFDGYIVHIEIKDSGSVIIVSYCRWMRCWSVLDETVFWAVFGHVTILVHVIESYWKSIVRP